MCKVEGFKTNNEDEEITKKIVYPSVEPLCMYTPHMFYSEKGVPFFE